MAHEPTTNLGCTKERLPKIEDAIACMVPSQEGRPKPVERRGG